MIPREFDAITKADIEVLVTNAVAEGRTIEYKQQLPGSSDADKREFLADVSSFANAGGGDIIYGVVEKRDTDDKPTGIPDRAEGLKAINADSEKLRLDESIRSGIDPRIPGYAIRSIDGFASGPVLVIRVPKSWALPHMVTFNKSFRFFSRTSAGKYQLDVREIRSAFPASADAANRISAFRTERLGKIIANEAPVSLSAGPKIILHLVPLTLLDSSIQFDLQMLKHDPNLAAPIYTGGYNNRFNLDGFLAFCMFGRGGCDGYVQVFRSGAFEAVDVAVFAHSLNDKLIPSSFVEEKIINAMNNYLEAAQRIGVPLPIVVMVTFDGLKDYAMATDSAWHNANPTNRIDRDVLPLPDVLLEDFSTPTDKLPKPVFDAFWQSAGFSSCEHYNNKGRRDGGQSRQHGGPG